MKRTKQIFVSIALLLLSACGQVHNVQYGFRSQPIVDATPTPGYTPVNDPITLHPLYFQSAAIPYNNMSVAAKFEVPCPGSTSGVWDPACDAAQVTLQCAPLTAICQAFGQSALTSAQAHQRSLWALRCFAGNPDIVAAIQVGLGWAAGGGHPCPLFPTGGHFNSAGQIVYDAWPVDEHAPCPGQNAALYALCSTPY